MDGKLKFEAARAKLHKEQEVKETQEKEAELEVKKEIQTQIAKLQENKSLADLYAENSQVGAENLSQELPILKVYTQGKSSRVVLADGSRPEDGWFIYKPTGEQFEKIVCHILTISRGYKAEGFNTGEEKFNQILAGVFANDHRPFLMFFTGKRLGNMWEFGKEASHYTKAKPVPIPLFALTVELSAHLEPNKYGDSWMVDFKILREAAGGPQIVLDEGEFVFLKDQVETIKDTLEQLIASKSKEEDAENQTIRSDNLAEPDIPKEEPIDGEVVDDETDDGELQVSPDEIPF